MIELKQISKRFGRFQALDRVSLKAAPGEVLAIMGPNGSGKSTLMKSLVGLVLPDSGEIRFKDRLIQSKSSWRHHLGYMPQIARYPENLTVAELMALIKDLRSLEESLDLDLFHALGIEEMEEKKLGALSGGMRQKVNATLAFLFAPDLLVLDEPTASLDPLSSETLKQKILKQKQVGKSVLLSSHLITEVEELADRLVYLLEGKICFDDSLESLRAQTGQNRLGAALAEWVRVHATQ
ncbi:copper ABC transporter ATP-binding protein [bacterium (Candidatus Blackallbacteria) CG17_big_fil_post_rev_8_21_14_2_50_48_46]|uniref:Copper ABC transporter ATP-binding protein n=1 Tax=bacterium (Candidatus Blackallbacteria) CG17_big_fil_post_rev_8_21_14_2_50_48_46 TaxID=2014261 RepID=A0A2M7G086_9BACT|nr:MAG: copper ABC transporter ATP-binding protein [bacterium (Candidatus Blackallbacteria) CG18_big_fil_WC_8_21_14_2_50_49_26]PIW15037.1 MAG: copper ABC transporter ATP-binding protein [bacterium (Candidatus Blackallbacteria) CG17_big_fil_post_rev_8_21_14_2_50_48_46]PIW47640.1 MAG: copper ABC transporter ATP-binding protein [bacterium (Candidatus Blackallbacteria) CG13_big_fil_rev_8_21_14_2_50_49_14]